MGGTGITTYEIAAIEAFVDRTRLPDLPDVDAAAAARGRVAFERSGCDECHAGAAFVDGLPHRILDLEADTPTLRGIGATAPYFHDGSAADLEAILVRTDVGVMGDTSGLSRAEKDDLIAYLKSL